MIGKGGAALLSLALLQAQAQDEALRQAARLDGEQKCEEAERYYRQAFATAPSSPAVLNNAGNHYLVCGQPEKARASFERLLKINPEHVNANLQLARLAVDRKQGARALEYLAHVKDSAPAVTLLRAEALHWGGKQAAALAILNGMAKDVAQDPRVQFAFGVTCARMGLYERAEAAFNTVLAEYPDDFELLFNLGRAAARARHYDRAERALEVALKLRPGDPDSLLELGLMYAERQDYSRAVYALAQAREQAPKRPDIVLALARASDEAGYYGDSALAYDEYLQLRPDEDTARRDRARVYGYTGARLEEGLKELAWYVGKHPDDPIGYFDQAQFLWRTDPEKALNRLSMAVRLDPNFGAARYGRAWLLHRLGRTAESLPDLKAAVRIDPKNVRVLDQLGLAYLSLDRPGEAEMVLRQALAVSPDDAEALMHLGRALMALNRGEEAQPFLAKFQKVRKAKPRDPRREAGMIELATLPQAERTERQIERLSRDARAHPGDAELQLRLASLLLAGGKREEAAAAFRELLTRNADSSIWEQAGAALVRAEQYELARDFLQRAPPGLDLAIALFFTEGPKQALEAIEKAPDGDQDVLLMKARILDAAGRPGEAEKVLEEGLRRAMPRPQVAQQTALLLLRHDRKKEALDFLDRATRRYPDDADLWLTQAVVQSLTDQSVLAEKTIRQIESRWPEWDRAYVAHGLLLERVGRAAEARQRFETAIALGSQDAAARCAINRGCACASGMEEMLFPSCQGR